MSYRVIPFVCLAAALAACQKTAPVASELPITPVIRGDIDVRVQATGVLEPINPVDIRSKASGQVTQMPVEVGTLVKQGSLLAQIDPRDVRNQFDQAMGDDLVAQATLVQALKQRARNDSLFARRVITQAQNDSTGSTTAAAVSQLTSARAALDLARQNLEDATVKAPVAGTIISRPTTQGQIITSATSPNGGTTLMTVADLGRVRMRVTIDEVEMANVRLGQTASAKFDAFPDREFPGTVEKIEPQAVVTQGVTFFPVLVSIDNKEGLLMPGMNGEVTIQAVKLSQVLQVPIDAVRPTNQLAPVARMFSLPVDTIINQLRTDLVGGQGTTGIPGRYVIVKLANGTYEMRLVKTGPTDLRTIQVVDGLKDGDQVVMLGAIMTGRPPVPPKLQIAMNMRRDAPSTRAASAAMPAPTSPSTSAPKVSKP